MASIAPTADRIDHIHVCVADRAAAERWYADVLGFSRIPELAFWAADGGPLTIANASGTVHLALFEKTVPPSRATIVLGVVGADFLAWKRHLETVLGSPVRVFDHQVAWSMYFTDPDLNPFEITCYEHDWLAQRLS